MLIPRIIHQTYPTMDLPPKLRANVEAIKAMNPGWDHRLYDDQGIESFIMDRYGSAMLASYRRIDPRYGAARADLFRYLVVHACGGVYLDIKSATVMPLDDVLRPDDAYVLSKWRNRPGEQHAGAGMAGAMRRIPGGEFQQWHVVAVPGHPFLKAVIAAVLRNIETYRPWSHGTGRRSCIRLAGPIPYTLAIEPIRHLHRHRVVRGELGIGLVYSVLDDERAHHALFETHYSRNIAPVVRADGLNGIAGRAYAFGKSILRPVQEPLENLAKSLVLKWRASHQ